MNPDKSNTAEYALLPYKQAIISVLYTGYWLSDRLNEQLKEFGLSEQQVNVLHILKAQAERACNLCTIQEKMMHKMSNATRLVEKLRLKGLVKREIDEENRRRVEVSLTEKGIRLLEKIGEKLNEYHCEHEAKLTDQEYLQLAELLDKMRK
ncbi:MAG: MarR family transcriptional regulator [Puia sp.]|nr:MarR family transcriptional regulator [Puia sp.]